MLVSLLGQEMGSHRHTGSNVGKGDPGKQSPEFRSCLDESEAAAERTEREERGRNQREWRGRKSGTPKHQRTYGRNQEQLKTRRWIEQILLPYFTELQITLLYANKGLCTWLSSGVMASSQRSRMRSSGGTSVRRNSKSSYSLLITCWREKRKIAWLTR